MIICPDCDNPVKESDINTEDGYAFCDICKNSFPLSDVPDNQTGQSQKPQSVEDIFKNPPKEVYTNKYEDKIIIGTSTRSVSGIVLLFIVAGGILWFMGSIIFGMLSWFIPHIKNSDGVLTYPPAYLLMFIFVLTSAGTLFLFGGFLISLLMAINGKVEVVLGKESYTFTGIGNIGITKKFDWQSVKKIYKRTWKTTGRRDSSGRRTLRTHYEIIIEGESKVNFGRILQGLYDKQFNYILAALKYYHERSISPEE